MYRPQKLNARVDLSTTLRLVSEIAFMLVRRRALQSSMCLCSSLAAFLYPRGKGTSSPFSFSFSRTAILPFLFARGPLPSLTPLLCANTAFASGQVRRRADSHQTGVFFPREGLTKALAILLSNLDREGV